VKIILSGELQVGLSLDFYKSQFLPYIPFPADVFNKKSG